MNTVVESAPQTDQVDALIKSIRIPPRPSLLADLQRELGADDPSPDAIGRIVASDVGMSGALLKLANSAVYGGRRKAKSIEQAILFLGINQVAALMTGLLARQAIPVNSAALANFWDLSTRRAHAMVFLTRRLRMGEPDVAHTRALLMDRFKDYEATYGAASMEAHRPFTDLENERHSTSHAAMGCLLARNWGLSDHVAWAILHHHDFAVIDDAATAGPVRSLIALSLLAENAICRYQGHAESTEWNKGGVAACAYLGLSDEETAEIMDELLEAFHED
jgi:HD-like signal output (HDOD) protein